jgi:hypothetical protein
MMHFRSVFLDHVDGGVCGFSVYFVDGGVLESVDEILDR